MKARYGEAEERLRTAIERLTDQYTTPKEAEAIYYLGATLKAQGKTDEAYKNFYAAAWSRAWKSPGPGTGIFNVTVWSRRVLFEPT